MYAVPNPTLEDKYDKGYYWVKRQNCNLNSNYYIGVKFSEVGICIVVTQENILIFRKYTQVFRDKGP